MKLFEKTLFTTSDTAHIHFDRKSFPYLLAELEKLGSHLSQSFLKDTVTPKVNNYLKRHKKKVLRAVFTKNSSFLGVYTNLVDNPDIDLTQEIITSKAQLLELFLRKHRALTEFTQLSKKETNFSFTTSHINSNTLNSAFSWGLSKKSSDFWYDLSFKWQKLYNKFADQLED